jgi:hypothetical protein
MNKHADKPTPTSQPDSGMQVLASPKAKKLLLPKPNKNYIIWKGLHW